MQKYLDLSHVGGTDALLLRIQPTANRNLLGGDAVIPPTPTWIARLLTSLHPAKEGLERQITAHDDVLQDLRMDTGQCWTSGFDRGQGRRLIGETQRLLALLPCVTACGQQMIVQPAALLTLLVEEALPLPGRAQALRERLTHADIACLSIRAVKPERPFIPSPNGRGLLAC